LKRRALLLVPWCVAARAQRPSTAQPNVQALPERLAMPGLSRELTLRLDVPPSYATAPTRRYPVLYLHDAQNLFDDASAFAGGTAATTLHIASEAPHNERAWRAAFEPAVRWLFKLT
jgi:predicted alpha/beta superfamily hydrolase